MVDPYNFAVYGDSWQFVAPAGGGLVTSPQLARVDALVPSVYLLTLAQRRDGIGAGAITIRWRILHGVGRGAVQSLLPIALVPDADLTIPWPGAGASWTVQAEAVCDPGAAGSACVVACAIAPVVPALPGDYAAMRGGR